MSVPRTPYSVLRTPLQNWLHQTAQDLSKVEGLSSSPQWEAEWLAAGAAGVDRVRVADGSLDWTAELEQTADGLKARRLARESLAYVLGEWSFLGWTMEVNASVLVPRPETEELVLEVLARASGNIPEDGRILDMGTGSGCIAVACALSRPGSRVEAVDISPAALQVARRNLLRHGVGTRVAVRLGHLWGAVPAEARYHILFANLPYIPSRVIPTLEPEVTAEPLVALDGGEDGLSLVREFIHGLSSHVMPQALVGLEVGWDQTDTVRGWLSDAGAAASVKHDAQGKPRMVIGKFK